ncbi:MAG: bifunctional riboflavin kinase/FAD synthetase [Solirubrobacterales bacterium]
MQTIYGLESSIPSGPIVLALGNFDGVHVGHQRLIHGAIETARSKGGQSAVMVFDPHPLQVLAPSKAPKLLTNTLQKAALLEKLGLDFLIITPFSIEIAAWTPEYFVESILAETLHVDTVFVGYNYTFGQKASGNAAMLAEFGQRFGFDVQIVQPVKIDHHTVSSSLVRKHYSRGDLESVMRFTGRFPVLEGIVVEGDRRGRTIGFPTANLMIPGEMALPGGGVYASVLLIDGIWRPAVTNVGTKPTFHEGHPISIETHVLDYKGDLYGRTLQLKLMHKLREEMKFAGPDDLVAQIKSDVADARSRLSDL